MESNLGILVKAATKIGLGWLAYKLFNKAIDNKYSISAKHKNSQVSLSPQGKS